VYIIGLEALPLRGVGYVPLVLATEKTLNPPAWSFIEKTISPVKLATGYCGLIVWSITLNKNLPSQSYGSHVGFAFSYYLCDNYEKSYIVIGTTQITQSFSL